MGLTLSHSSTMGLYLLSSSTMNISRSNIYKVPASKCPNYYLAMPKSFYKVVPASKGHKMCLALHR